MKSIGVIVIGGHIQALGIIRICGRENIPAIIIDKSLKNIARHSKYCQSYYHADEHEVISILESFQTANMYKGWLIFPTNDSHVKDLSINKSKLEPYFIVTVDEWSVIQNFYNKIQAYRLVNNLKIPIPETHYPNSIDYFQNVEIRYPCIIKPAIMHTFYSKTKQKVFVCNTFEELKENYSRAAEFLPSDQIMVQEIIPGPSKNQFSACFLFLNGEPYVSLTACRMRQHPLDFGNATTYAEAYDIPVLKEYAIKILNAARYNGLCEVEFKFDERDGLYKFLEVNTRTWKWHSIANQSNVSFIITYYRYLTEKTITPIHSFKESSYYHFLTDFPIQLKLLLKGYRYALRIKRPIEMAVWALDDIKPWIFEKLYIFSLIKSR